MISAEDKQRIAGAIRAAEGDTAGEIVCVLARASSDYSHVSALWAAFVALASPWLLVALTDWSVHRILAAQIVIFIVAALLFSWPALRMALTPRAIQRVRAHRAAMEQFSIRGLTQTPNRMGVMIYVSMAEHYARVVADVGIAAKVDHKDWQETVDLLTAHIRDKRVADGFVAAIGKVGALLARHAPPDGSGDTLPDRIYVI